MFIVGCPHSGTSILLRILDNGRPFCAIPYESYLFIHHDTPFEMARAKRYFLRLTLKQSAERWIEKTPAHIGHIPRIREEFPKAQILGIYRNPLDVVASHLQRGLTLKWSIDNWNNAALTLIKKRNKEYLHLVCYESLVEKPQKTVKGIIKFLNETYYPYYLELGKKKVDWYAHKTRKRHIDRKNHEKFRNWQINQPLFDSRGRYKEVLTQKQIERVIQNTVVNYKKLYGKALDPSKL